MRLLTLGEPLSVFRATLVSDSVTPLTELQVERDVDVVEFLPCLESVSPPLPMVLAGIVALSLVRDCCRGGVSVVIFPSFNCSVPTLVKLPGESSDDFTINVEEGIPLALVVALPVLRPEAPVPTDLLTGISILKNL